MHVLFSKPLKTSFVLSIFILTSSCFSMEHDPFEELNDGYSAIGSSDDRQAIRDEIAKRFNTGFNILRNWVGSKANEEVVDEDENSSKATENANTEDPQPDPATDMPIKNAREAVEQVENMNEQVKDDNKPVAITWLTKKNAARFGIGAVAVITVGCVTYVLYKNGILKKVADAMKKHSYVTAGLVAGTLAFISGFFAYKYYYVKPVSA